MKNTVTVMKSTLEGISSRLYDTEEQINKLENNANLNRKKNLKN